MQQSAFHDVTELEAAVGSTVGVSDWFTITQETVNAFAEVTGDHQWIHVDPERAKRESPFGGPVAHGFLTVSLLPRFTGAVLSFPTAKLTINYGFDRLRFVSPVPVGSEIRATFAIEEVRRKEGNSAEIVWRVDVEIKGAAKPAVAALWLSRVVFG
jgi:acyl dehydratase